MAVALVNGQVLTGAQFELKAPRTWIDGSAA